MSEKNPAFLKEISGDILGILGRSSAIKSVKSYKNPREISE